MSNERAAAAPESPEKVESAADVVRQLVKLLKTRRLYAAQNVQTAAAASEFRRLVSAHLERHGDLVLEVTRDTFAVQGVPVYEEPSRDANLAVALYLGGVRELAVHPGVTERELEDLVAVLASSRSEDLEVASRLWEAEFEHVAYVCLDELSEGWDKSEGLSQNARGTIDRMDVNANRIVDFLAKLPATAQGGLLIEASSSGSDLVRLQKAEHEGAALDDDDDDEDYLVAVPEILVSSCRTKLQESLASDRLVSELLVSVLDGLALDREAIGETPALWFIGEAAAVALRRNGLALLTDVVERYTTELTAAQGDVARALARALEEVGRPESVERIAALGSAEGVDPARLCSLLEALGRPGIAVAARILRRATSKALKDALTAFVSANLAAAPEELAPLVDAGAPPEIARATLGLVAKGLKGTAAETLYEAARRHPAKAVSDYASFLWRTQTSRGRLKAFLDALDSKDPAERIRAATAIGTARDQEALEPLIKLIDDPSFLSRTPEEVKAFLAAVAAIGGPRAKTFLQGQTTRSTGIFRVRAGTEIRANATEILRRLTESSDRLPISPTTPSGRGTPVQPPPPRSSTSNPVARPRSSERLPLPKTGAPAPQDPPSSSGRLPRPEQGPS